MSNKKVPYTKCSKSIRQQMIDRDIFNPDLQYSGIYLQIKKFIGSDLASRTGKWKENVKEVFKVVDEEMAKANALKRFWMRVFAVHGVFRLIINSDCQYDKESFIDLLQQLQAIMSKLNTLPFPQQCTPSILSMSITSIKRSLSTKSIKNLFLSKQKKQQFQHTTKKIGQKKNNVSGKNDRENEKDFESQWKNILGEYVGYLLKVVNDWEEVGGYIGKRIQKTVSVQGSQHFPKQISNSSEFQHFPKQDSKQQTKRQIKSDLVWKILNYFKILLRITKSFQRLCQLMKEYQAYMFGTIEYMAEDIQMLYNSIMEYISQQLKQINWVQVKKTIQLEKPYSLQKQRLNSSSLHKKPITKLPVYIVEDILQLKSMVEQLGLANEVVLFVFRGSYHYNNLQNKRLLNSFLSINDERFDIVYEVAKKIELKKEKKKEVQVKERQKVQLSQRLKNLGKNQGIINSLKSQTVLDPEQENCKAMTSRNTKVNNVPQTSQRCNRMMAVKFKSARIQQLTKVTVKKGEIIAETGKVLIDE